MRIIIILFLLLTGHCVFSQSTGDPKGTGVIPTAPKIVTPFSVQKPFIINSEPYKHLINNLSDADAWLQYFKWLNNDKELSPAEKQDMLQQTISSSKQYIAAGWQFWLMNFIQSGKRNSSFLNAALDASSQNGMVLPYAVHYAVITQDEILLKKYATALNEVSPLSPALYEYHYNTLMSVEKNAVLYAKGLSDLGPMAVLQKVYGIRKDVRFRYYEQFIADTTNAYICLSTGKDILSHYPHASYSGLVVKISDPSSSQEVLRVPESFKLQQLNSLQQLGEDEKIIYKNYLPSFILLYRSCRKNNDALAGHWKSLIQKIGRLTGTTAAVNKMLDK